MTTPSSTTSSESLGQTSISERALARIVSAAADSVPGTTRQTRSLDNITARRYPRFDVEINESARSVSIEAYIAVLWPAPVTAVATRVRDAITAWVEELTDFSVSRVNVVTGPIIHQGKRVTRELIDAAPSSPPVSPVTVRKSCELREVSGSAAKSQKSLTDVTVQKKSSVQVWAPKVPEAHSVVEVASPASHTAWVPQAPQSHKALTPQVPRRHRPYQPQVPRHHRLAQPSVRKVAATKSVSITGARRGTAPITVRKLRPTTPVVVNRGIHLRAQAEKGVPEHE